MDFLQKVSKLRWMPIRHWFYLQQSMNLKVKTRDPEDGQRYVFLANSLFSYVRGKQLLTKEPDTIAWLRRQLRPDDVFLDIGANVGAYSIFAAKHLSNQGHVYACEPHLPTTVQLMQNIAANHLQDRVSVLSVAVLAEPVHHRQGYYLCAVFFRSSKRASLSRVRDFLRRSIR